MNYAVIAMSLASLLSSSSYAGQLSLQELMETVITVSSKTEESLVDSPGAVTSYSRKDLDRTGYSTIEELANITAGYSTTQSFGEVGFTTRGESVGAFDNNRHLVLIDGIPVYNARAYKAPISKEFPLYFADRVDFLRGPASALYGINAFQGVVSVSPQFMKEKGARSRFDMKQSSDDKGYSFNGVSLHRNDSGRFEIAASVHHNDASRDQVGRTDDENRLYWNDLSTSFMRVNYSSTQQFPGLSLGVISFSRESSIGEFWAGYSSQANQLQFRSHIPYVKYEGNLGSNIKIDSYIKFNESHESGYWPIGIDSDLGDSNEVFASYDITVKNLELSGDLSWGLSEDSRLLAGLSLDRRQQIGSSESYNGAFMTIDSINNNYKFNYDNGEGTLGLVNRYPTSDPIDTVSSHLQIQQKWPVLDGLKLTLGVRGDFSTSKTNQYFQSSPRLAMVQNISPELSLKLLYGNALKAPGIKEIGLNSDAKSELKRKGLDEAIIEDVEAETVETQELVLLYHKGSLMLSLTLFQNQTEKSLQNVSRTTNELDGSELAYNSFVNEGSIQSNGAELEIRYEPNERFWSMLSLSNAYAKNHQDARPQDIPNGLGNLVLGGRVDAKLSGSIACRYIDHYAGVDRDEFASRTILGTHWRYQVAQGAIAKLSLDNILNEDYLVPRGGEALIPQSGRSLSLGFQLAI